MAAIEALYIYDRYSPTPSLLLQHTYRPRAAPPAPLLSAYLSHPTQPPPSLLYIPSLPNHPPTLLASTLHHNLLLLSPSSSETDPLALLTLHTRILDALTDYLSPPLLPQKLNDTNLDTILQLLTEIADEGIPFTTEPNALRDVVLPPSTLGRIFGSVTGLPSNTLPAALAPGSQPPAQLSAIPWRRANVKHTANEMFVDVVEMLRVTLAPSGRPIAAIAAGTIAFTSKISGIPDLLLTLSSPTSGGGRKLGLAGAEVFRNPSFHPCVRLSHWSKRPGELSFVPPDGKFILASYEVDILAQSTPSPDGFGPSSIPLPVTLDITPHLGVAKDEFEIRVFVSTSSLSTSSASSSVGFGGRSPRLGASGTGGGATVEEVTISVRLPGSVKNLTGTRCSRGEMTFENGVMTWRILGASSSGEGARGAAGVAGTATLRTGVVVRDEEEDDDEGEDDSDDEDDANGDYDEFDTEGKERREEMKEKEKREREKRKMKTVPMPRAANIDFAVKGWLASGVKVEGLRIVGGKGVGEGVKPYKGVKYLTRSGGVEVRC